MGKEACGCFRAVPMVQQQFSAIEQHPSPNPHNHRLKSHWDKGWFRNAAIWLQSSGVPVRAASSPTACSGVSTGGDSPDTGSENCCSLGQLWLSARYESSLFACFYQVCRKLVLLKRLFHWCVGLESAKRLKALHMHRSCPRFLMKPEENFL